MTHFEVILSYKAAEKDGGKRFQNTLNIWANTKMKASEIANKLWNREYAETDLSLLSVSVL